MSRTDGNSSASSEASPEGPEAGPGDFAPAKLEPGLRREFLLQAGLLNAGVLAGGAGLVMLAFTDELSGGILLTALGTTLLLLATWRYRRQAPSA